MNGILKIDKRMPALIATKRDSRYAKGEIIEVGSKKALKELLEDSTITLNAETEMIKVVRD